MPLSDAHSPLQLLRSCVPYKFIEHVSCKCSPIDVAVVVAVDQSTTWYSDMKATHIAFGTSAIVHIVYLSNCL